MLLSNTRSRSPRPSLHPGVYRRARASPVSVDAEVAVVPVRGAITGGMLGFMNGLPPLRAPQDPVQTDVSTSCMVLPQTCHDGLQNRDAASVMRSSLDFVTSFPLRDSRFEKGVDDHAWPSADLAIDTNSPR